MISNKTRLWSNEDFLLSLQDSHCYIHYNCSVELHFHSFVEINIITDGKGIHHIYNTDIEAKKGYIFIIPPNTTHSYKNIDNLTVNHIILSDNFFSKFEKELNSLENYTEIFKVLSFLPNSHYYLFLNDQNLTTFNSFWSVLEANNLTNPIPFKKTNTQNILADGLILSFIAFLCSNFNSAKQETNFNVIENYLTITKAIEYISQHYNEKLTNTLLSSICNLSESSFLRYFNQVLQTTPATYITIQRINYAKILLEKSPLSITNISQETGFFDSSHFNRTFKKFTGTSPLEYRKKHKLS